LAQTVTAVQMGSLLKVQLSDMQGT